MADGNGPGKIGWIDMTTTDAPRLRDFYKAVAGWEPEDVDMGGYSDYVMKSAANGEPAAGICHSRGSNADLPPGWLIYIVVADISASVAACVEHGGTVIVQPRALSGGRFCVIEDPGGAAAALYQPAGS